MRIARRSPFAIHKFVWLAVHLCGTLPAMVAAIEPDFLMDTDPPVEVPPPVASFSPALKSLWLAALERPEADMQRMAAETIARAHQRGVPDLVDTVPALERVMQAESSHPAARFAAARALISLDSRGSADELFEVSQKHGADLRQLVEPALANWDHGPARKMWMARLGEPESTRRDQIQAMRGLSTVREPAVLPQLLSLANDLTNDAGLRLEAARAAGGIAATGLEQAAESLARDVRAPHFVNQLCAVQLLSRHDGEAARRILIELAAHAEPAVAAASLARLNEIDPALVLPIAETALKSRDPLVRRQGVTAYTRLPAVDRIDPLGELLADPHPGIRRDVAENLLRLSETPELHDPVCGVAMRILGGDDRQRESALLLGTLDHKPATTRLIELLESPRAEVMTAAAWALRKLAVPQTVPALIDKAARQTQHREQDDVSGLDDQVAHLFEALGTMHAADAEPLLRQYVSKRFYSGNRSRGAAIWAIGQLKAGTRDAELEDALSGRLTDFADRQPETPLVKQMCAVALARMQATDQATTVRSIVARSPRPARLAVTLRWAVKELTGEELPPPEPERATPENWFLEPIP